MCVYLLLLCIYLTNAMVYTIYSNANRNVHRACCVVYAIFNLNLKLPHSHTHTHFNVYFNSLLLCLFAHEFVLNLFLLHFVFPFFSVFCHTKTMRVFHNPKPNKSTELRSYTFIDTSKFVELYCVLKFVSEKKRTKTNKIRYELH